MREHWLTRAMSAGFTFGRMAELVSRELSYSGDLPLRERVQLWRRGFCTPSGVIYGPSNTASGDYLPDYARFVQTPRINGRYARMLDNKLAFTSMMDEVRPGTVPRLLGTISRGQLSLRDDGELSANDTSSALDTLLERHQAVVIKPVEGTLGIGVLFVARRADGALLLNGDPVSRSDLLRRLDDCKADIVTELVHQATYARAIHPPTTNTIRMLTLRDPDGDVVVPAAAHRFGAAASGPIDAWHQGGVSAGIDLETGTMGPAASAPNGSGIDWLSHHPDTGERIEGVEIPGWTDMIGEITEIARRLPFLPYIGWDPLITDDGFRVIEGNNRSELDLLQVHTPLLRDERVRRFYERHGVSTPVVRGQARR